jgi:hypothetical protein
MLTNEVAMDVMNVDIQMINQELMKPKGIQVRSIFSHSVVQKPKKVFRNKIKSIDQVGNYQHNGVRTKF